MTIKSFLVLVVLGGVAGAYAVYVLKMKILGKVWGAVVAGIAGAIIGFSYLRWLTRALTQNPLDVDVVAALIGAFLLIWILHRLSPHRYEE